MPSLRSAHKTWGGSDYQIQFPISQYAEAIGCTGWNWERRVACWVGYDFDSITGHAQGVGVSDAQLDAVREAACAVPWVEVRRSTGGSGLHLYVLLDDIPTANHTEHAALGRAVLGMLQREANFDFGSAVDACGGNMWIWHRKMTAENGGLLLLKEAEHQLNVHDLPSNWRDHVEVVTRKRSKIRLQRVKKEETFEQLTSARTLVPLDDKHKQTIDALKETGYLTDWVSDYHLLQTHTCAFKALSEDCNARAELGLVGFFNTLSSGEHPDEPNCFAFPTGDGGWRVYRFNEGAKEADSWEQDGSGWTWCTFNRVPDFRVAARAYSGAERSEGGFQFDRASDATKTADALGVSIDLPPSFGDRQAILKINKDGRLVIHVKAHEGEAKPAAGWVSRRGGWWERVTNGRPPQPSTEDVDPDNFLRELMTPDGERIGSFVVTDTGELHCHPSAAVSDYLQSHGFTRQEASEMHGRAIRKPWTQIQVPFTSEYPGNRQWNRHAPQLRVAPSTDRDNLSHPHWDMIFNHAGQSLDEPLKKLDWAVRANIITGGDYFKAVFASILQQPLLRTPYIALHGPEKSGKSIIWEASKLLVTKGVVLADQALTSATYNGELEGAVFCAIEEVNVAQTASALAKMKFYTTASMIPIRRMRCDVYCVPNTTHFFQFTNVLSHVPLTVGDTRITLCHVPALAPGQQIPMPILLGHLAEETPAILRTLLDFQLPEQTDRLRIPVVETNLKRESTDERAPLAEFLRDCCVVDHTHQTSKFRVYTAYELWAAGNGDDCLVITEFGKQLGKLDSISVGTRIMEDGKRRDTYRGIRLTPETAARVSANLAARTPKAA